MNESTLVPREEMSDLDWLARNVHEFPAGQEFAWISRDVYFSPVAPLSGDYFTKQQWLARRAELQNKPSWGAVPINANWIAQDAAGTWIWHWNKPEHRNGMWINGDTRGYAAKGAVLGDWRDTLEKRPEQDEFEPFVSAEDAATPNQRVTLAQLIGRTKRITPSKYTKTIHGVSVDVYDVLQAWCVSNPALQHLIKKALQCGQRGHKDNAQDLQDIIDSAIRAKELES